MARNFACASVASATSSFNCSTQGFRPGVAVDLQPVSNWSDSSNRSTWRGVRFVLDPLAGPLHHSVEDRQLLRVVRAWPQATSFPELILGSEL